MNVKNQTERIDGKEILNQEKALELNLAQIVPLEEIQDSFGLFFETEDGIYSEIILGERKDGGIYIEKTRETTDSKKVFGNGIHFNEDEARGLFFLLEKALGYV